MLIIGSEAQSRGASGVRSGWDRGEVWESQSVAGAIELAARFVPAVMVLQVSLQELAATDALRRLHATTPGCRIVLVPHRGRTLRLCPPAGRLAEVIWPAAPMAVMREQTLPSRPESAGEARRMVLEACAEAGDGALYDDAALVMTELVANAITHARTEVGVSVQAQPGTVRIEVRDGAPARPAARVAGPLASNGRGLMLMDALCCAWGIDPSPEGKAIWAHLAPA